MLKLDHIVIVAETLEAGSAHVSGILGVPVQAGGKHAFMGTHNMLLSLGPEIYLEVIAIDPEASKPDRRRWFGMDTFEGAARLTNWVCSSDALAEDLARAPAGMADVIDAARDDLRWKMAVPTHGQYPFDGAFPGMIAWEGAAHPCQKLTDQGVRLELLEIGHPEAGALEKALQSLEPSAPVRVVEAGSVQMSARFATPNGSEWL